MACAELAEVVSYIYSYIMGISLENLGRDFSTEDGRYANIFKFNLLLKYWRVNQF